MISARNHRQRSSGNKTLLFFCLLLIAACSPKIRKGPDTPVKEREKTVEKKEARRFTQGRISLLLPFQLNRVDLAAATKAEIERSSLAIDYYQGFKLGLDSASAGGLNFQLNVFDTGDQNGTIATLYKKEDFQRSHLIVGPVFPDGQKFVASYTTAHNIPVVSPLAASGPREFNNPNLISIVPNIGLHAERIGNYIAAHHQPEKTVVVLINPKKTEDEIFAAPLRSFFRNSKAGFIFQEFASVYTMETRMMRDRNYIVIIASADKNFVTPSLDKLYKLKFLKTGGYPISVFGHPNWVKQGYSIEKLQKLNACISSSYKVNYQSAGVRTFIRKYRTVYGFEPAEYAFKGFDSGFYFGRLLSRYGDNYLKHLVDEQYTGLQNAFKFTHDPQLGYINTSVMLLRYSNYSLQVID